MAKDIEAGASYAKLVTRRSYVFPFRNQRYWDCTPWHGGWIRHDGAPGAVVVDAACGLLLNLRSGEVYADSRFIEVPA
jgi:hypothetical protein